MMQNSFENLLLKKLLNTITPEEEKDFNLWLKANPEYESVYMEQKTAWEAKEADAPEFNIKNKSHNRASQSSNRTVVSKTKKLKPFIVGNLIAVILMVIATMLFYRGVSIGSKKITSEELSKTIVLTDGTIVSLKPHSSLVVPRDFSASRSIELNGQAYFKSGSKERLPLTVRLGSGTVTSYGSEFIVKENDDKQGNDIVVLSGKTMLAPNDSKGQRTVLTSRMSGTLSQARTKVLNNVDTVGFQLWKTDKLIFRNANLYDLANTISEYYGVDLHVHDGLNGCRFTSTLKQVSLDEVLDAVSQSIPVQVTKENGKITLDAKQCGK